MYTSKLSIAARRGAVAAAVAAVGMLATSAVHASSFPALGFDSGPAVIVNLGAGGVFTTTYTGQGPYDGIEDTYVGVVNAANSGLALSSINISGNFIFGFDGDGQAAYTGIYYDGTGYAGPNTSFSIANYNNGTVFFNVPLQPGQTAWFTLEETINGANGNVLTVGGGGTTNAPDGGSTAVLLGGAVLGLGLLRRRF